MTKLVIAVSGIGEVVAAESLDLVLRKIKYRKNAYEKVRDILNSWEPVTSVAVFVKQKGKIKVWSVYENVEVLQTREPVKQVKGFLGYRKITSKK